MCPTGGGSRKGVRPRRLAALCHPLNRKMSSHGWRKSIRSSESVRAQKLSAKRFEKFGAGEVPTLLWAQLGCIYGRSPPISASLSWEIKAHILPSLPSSPPSVFTTRVIKTSHSVSMRLLQPGSSESGKDPDTSSSFLPQKDNPHTSSRRIFTSTSVL